MKKNDRLDAEKICDLVRCDLLPVSYMAPPEIRQLRRVLRYRNLLPREAVRLRIASAGCCWSAPSSTSRAACTARLTATRCSMD